MESSLKVYLIGMVVGFATLMLSAQEINEDTFSSTANFIKGIGIVVASVWLFFYMAMILISLPFLAIEPLKKYFTRKRYLPFPFMAAFLPILTPATIESKNTPAPFFIDSFANSSS